MSLYRRGDIWHYDFWFRCQRHRASTGQIIKSDALQCEREIRRLVRRRGAGLEPRPQALSPRFQDWAEVHYRERRKHMTRPDVLEHHLRVVLRFWGARPDTGDVPSEPYHDLRLNDVVRDPTWIEQFEVWMRARGSSPQSRNHYRSTLRGMFNTALLPAYRAASGITINPFRDVARDTVMERTVTVTVEELRQWLAAASYHIRLAVAIAALAPKLRLASVLALTWSENIDADFRFISVRRHKTITRVRRPQVVPISEQLRSILHDARRRTHTHVVEYRRRPIKSIRGGLQAAASRAGLAYGRDVGGVTFHSLRHTAASLLAELGESEAIRKEVMGIAISPRPSDTRVCDPFTRYRRSSAWPRQYQSRIW